MNTRSLHDPFQGDSPWPIFIVKFAAGAEDGRVLTETVAVRAADHKQAIDVAHRNIPSPERAEKWVCVASENVGMNPPTWLNP